MSLSLSEVAGEDSRVSTSRRPTTSEIRQLEVLEACCSRYSRPITPSASDIHTKVAVTSEPRSSRWPGSTITSPRPISISSAVVTVTARPAPASSRSASKVMIRSIAVVRPDGSTSTSSPARSVPSQIVPA